MKQIILKPINFVRSLVARMKKSGRTSEKKAKNIKVMALFGVGLAVLGVLIYLFLKNPSALIVAKVNGKYISRMELNKLLIKSYGTQTLQDLAYKKIAEDEFKKNNIVISQAELDARLSEIEKGLGGMSLEDALSSSGMSIDDLKDNVVLQMSLEELLADKVVVTPEDVKAFLEQNAAQMKDMTDEEKTTYAQDQLKQQNLQIEMGKWFNEIKENANIKLYL